MRFSSACQFLKKEITFDELYEQYQAEFKFQPLRNLTFYEISVRCGN